MSDYGTPTISGGWEPRRRPQLPADFPTDEDVEVAAETLLSYLPTALGKVPDFAKTVAWGALQAVADTRRTEEG